MSKPRTASAANGSLFLSPEPPFPPIGGGSLRSAALLTYLSRRGPVDRILFREPPFGDPSAAIPPEIEGENCVLVLPFHRKDRLSRLHRNAWRALRAKPALMDRFAGFTPGMKRFLAGRRYRVGVIEHFWCAPYLNVLKEHCEEVWLNLHNIESVLQERSREVSSVVDAIGYRRFASIYRREERVWFPRFDRVLATSENDAALVRQIAPQARTIILPNTIPELPRPERVEEDVVAFSGNLAYPPNIEAVRFFTSEVWPVLQERWPGLRWRIVGKNPEAVVRYLRGEKYIQVSGPVEDAVRELAKAKVAVVPVRTGSGTRVKILEAWAAATPVVSTSLGAEGLPVRDGEHLLLADDAKLFAETVSGLLASQDRRARIGEAGRRLYETSFTWPAGWRVLDKEFGCSVRSPVG